ncbi:MAG: arginine deiminase family protein [Bacteroidota bacterium]
MQLHIKDEISPLKAVILGSAKSNGPIPSPEDAYDPTSLSHILAGTYPLEDDMIEEMEGVARVLERHGVTVYRPTVLEDYNQIFARDISFVIEDKFFVANILPEREREIDALEHVWKGVPKENRIQLPEACHIEGGDVMPWGDYIFVGTYRGDDYPDFITARTNIEAVAALQELFPKKIVKSFNLKKSNTDPLNSALHLDCCFQPLGKGKALIHKDGFLEEDEYQWLIDFFGKDNFFHVTKEEMAGMNCNVFSISPDVVISAQHFTRLNEWLREQGFTVEEVPYKEISKQGGLLRCSTMPLNRG